MFIMEREYITRSRGFSTDLLIRGRFLITEVVRKIAINETPYYNIILNYEIGNLNAKRFTNGQSEFDSLNSLYLVGNIIEIEGIYQNKFHSVKILSEKFIESVEKKKFSSLQENSEVNFQKGKLSALKMYAAKLDELINLFEFGTSIQIKSYFNDLLQSHFSTMSKKKRKEFQKFIEELICLQWPKERHYEFLREFRSAIEMFKLLQPAKWRKWGSFLFKLISIIR